MRQNFEQATSEEAETRESTETPETARTEQPTTKRPKLSLSQRLAGELLGTLLLVLFHAGAATSLRVALHASGAPKELPDVLYLGLADGLSLFVIILIVGKVSGVLINPAVTLGLAIVGRFPREEIAPYIAAQCVGAVAGAGAVLLVFGGSNAIVGHVGAVALALDVSLIQVMLVEALGTFVLVLTISATAEDPRSPSGWAAFAIGMALGAVVLLIEPITGGAANPARALGSDVIYALAGGSVKWLDYIVAYLLGPLIGAVAATALYRVLSSQPDTKPAPEGNEHAAMT